MTEMETTQEGRNGSTMTLPADAVAVANDFGQRAMGAAQTTARNLDGALKRLDDESEGSLTIGAAFSLGVASGLLIGGGPRLLAVIAGAPGIAMALALLRRTEVLQTSSTSSRASKA
jgi:glucokinase